MPDAPAMHSPLGDLAPRIHDELRALAGALFRDERKAHTLQPTALVHEAWLRLARSEGITLGDRASFLAIACITMRRILVEHARKRDTDKRGAGWTRVTLDAIEHVEGGGSSRSREAAEIDVLAVHEALEALAALSGRQARIVEMRWFGGLTVPEIAQLLGLVPRTVEKDLAMAKAWLRTRLAPGAR
jgi:RNA polymerase sigma-70 factor, ECF subfamily